MQLAPRVPASRDPLVDAGAQNSEIKIPSQSQQQALSEPKKDTDSVND